MDLWDLTKVLLRRWYVTVPMLLATVAATAWVLVNVAPEHEATGHVAVIPPEVQRVAEAGQLLRVSPWNEEALAHAAQIRLEAKRLEDELAAAGYEGTWTVEITGRLPVVSVTVVAPTAESAIATLHRLQDLIEEEVRFRQDGPGLPEQEQFSTVRYDTGESIDTSATRLRRLAVAALGAGLIFTVSVVVMIDAVLRWRRDRRATPSPSGPDPVTAQIAVPGRSATATGTPAP